jgi:hypothetical protein
MTSSIWVKQKDIAAIVPQRMNETHQPTKKHHCHDMKPSKHSAHATCHQNITAPGAAAEKSLRVFSAHLCRSQQHPIAPMLGKNKRIKWGIPNIKGSPSN